MIPLGRGIGPGSRAYSHAMRELLATSPWRTLFRASQWLLAVSLVVPAVIGLRSVFPALYFIAFGIPLAIAIRVGERLWSTGRTGLLLAIGDLGALTLALVVMVVEPWTQLQMVVPGEEPMLLAVSALAIVGLIGSPFGATRVTGEPRPSMIGGAVVLAIHAALILLLLELLADAMGETDPMAMPRWCPARRRPDPLPGCGACGLVGRHLDPARRRGRPPRAVGSQPGGVCLVDSSALRRLVDGGRAGSGVGPPGGGGRHRSLPTPLRPRSPGAGGQPVNFDLHFEPEAENEAALRRGPPLLSR
jgi:hypothetical protein